MSTNCGIYQIENLQTGDIYIGQSKDLEYRRRLHFWHLERGSHYNIHLQRAYNKYGKKFFIFKPIDFCKKSELTSLEQHYVDKLNPQYNICRKAVDSPKGVVRSQETRERISKSNKGKHNITEETRRKLKEKSHQRGKPRTEDEKRRISIKNSGSGNGMYGRGVLKELCKRGHPLTPSNVYVSNLKNGKKLRVCRTCHIARNLKYRKNIRPGFRTNESTE